MREFEPEGSVERRNHEGERLLRRLLVVGAVVVVNGTVCGDPNSTGRARDDGAVQRALYELVIAVFEGAVLLDVAGLERLLDLRPELGVIGDAGRSEGSRKRRDAAERAGDRGRRALGVVPPPRTQRRYA